MKKLISLIVIATILNSCGDNPVYIAHPDFQGQIDSLNERVDNLDNRLITFSAELTQVSNDLDSIENNIQIDRIESPCIDSQEVLIYLSDGRIMAYFEQGSKRYLSILASGTYRTTDNNNCIFTI